MILEIVLSVILVINSILLVIASEKLRKNAHMKHDYELVKYSNDVLSDRLKEANNIIVKLKIDNDLLRKEKRDVQKKMNEVIKTIRRNLDK